MEYIWHRIKRGQTLNSIAKRNGIEDWKVLYEHNRDLLRNPNILNYIDEDIYDIGWCINNKQGIVRIPILNSQDQEEERKLQVEMQDEYPVSHGDEEIKDTPEEKEEWEEEFMEVLETFKDEICSNFFASSKPLTNFIKQLLLEREREVLNSMREWVVEYHKDNWDIRDFDAEIAIGKIIDRELDKLNK